MITGVDTEKLLSLIKSFHGLTGMKVAVFDTDFCERLSYPENESVFCTMMRENEEFCRECHNSEKSLCRACAESKSVIIEKCHAGLTEVVAPLSNGISIIGYIMFGQITNVADKADFEKDVLNCCRKYNMDNNKLISAIKTVPYYSDCQAEDAARILKALGVYIVFDKIVYAREKPLAYEITEYIKNNLDKNLSVDSLCNKFSVSKSGLYRELRPYVGGGIAEFIKELRLEKAAALLAHTQKPIWEIAAESGFSDSDYFLRIFKKEIGISAGRYRKERQ